MTSYISSLSQIDQPDWLPLTRDRLFSPGSIGWELFPSDILPDRNRTQAAITSAMAQPLNQIEGFRRNTRLLSRLYRRTAPVRTIEGMLLMGVTDEEYDYLQTNYPKALPTLAKTFIFPLLELPQVRLVRDVLGIDRPIMLPAQDEVNAIGIVEEQVATRLNDKEQIVATLLYGLRSGTAQDIRVVKALCGYKRRDQVVGVANRALEKLRLPASRDLFQELLPDPLTIQDLVAACTGVIPEEDCLEIADMSLDDEDTLGHVFMLLIEYGIKEPEMFLIQKGILGS